jgi:hypothetical protein
MSDVKTLWEEVKATVLAVELDVLKNAEGNVSAGVRARRGLRMLRTKVNDLVKVLKQEDQAKKEARKASRGKKDE